MAPAHGGEHAITASATQVEARRAGRPGARASSFTKSRRPACRSSAKAALTCSSWDMTLGSKDAVQAEPQVSQSMTEKTPQSSLYHVHHTRSSCAILHQSFRDVMVPMKNFTESSTNGEDCAQKEKKRDQTIESALEENYASRSRALQTSVLKAGRAA
ncbi:hypothetical protein NDU88_006795 [Pleurodeles waltl]|uniref:Uncharacterized protein n=1 Tax=Pleurodeles waltl TaxID=8319 RepID=A0AAV7RT14_PLEWA|nr:hypothetical protein NDU88_006795 [Pleurodeles waltl]